ncbi:MAG: hypothetical protein H7Y36_11780 [Armatimonadetes bacterium]|nr:hypothetical protein [Akkermansiaceae bacterium]
MPDPEPESMSSSPEAKSFVKSTEFTSHVLVPACVKVATSVKAGRE